MNGMDSYRLECKIADMLRDRDRHWCTADELARGIVQEVKDWLAAEEAREQRDAMLGRALVKRPEETP